MIQTLIYRKWLAVTAILVLLLSLLPLIPSPVYAIKPQISAQTFSKQATGQPIEVKVGVYVLTLGDLDMATGNYTMDFFLSFSCDQKCNPDSFDIMNGEVSKHEDQTSDDLGGTFRAYRVSASLITNLDVRDYPFDEHDLIIEMEDKLNNTDKLRYVVDEKASGVDSSAVVSGWQIKGTPGWKAEVVDHYYPIYDSSYSRYRFYVTIYHPWQSSFLKGLFAPIVIVIVGLLSVLMKAEKISDRLALTTSSLVGAILYHLSVISSIPPVGYLTYMDKFMLANYFVIAAALAVTVAMMVYQDNNFPARAEKLNNWTRGLIPLAWVILLAFITITQFVVR
jgi:hypothetical protein